MTDDERFSLLVSVMGANATIRERDPRIPDDVPMSAGYMPGVPRLGVPALLMSDASLGVTNPGYRPGDTATALPAWIALGASFNPALARAAGELLGREARSRGFNVHARPAASTSRATRATAATSSTCPRIRCSAPCSPRESVNGIQGEGVISTIKHYSLNCNETNRHWLDAVIDPDAHRESDLLAFEIAIERSQPGAVMTAYNKVNGDYAGGNGYLLNEVLKGAWGYPGWVMSDWGATPSWEFALAGAGPGVRRADRRHDLGRRAVHRAAARGVRRRANSQGTPVGHGAPHPALDLRGRHRRVGAARPRSTCRARRIALETARQGIVLLKNDGVLPLAADTTARIAVIGGYAQLGVPAAPARARSSRPAVTPLRSRRRPGHDGQHAQPVPAAVLAGRRSCRRLLPEARDRVRPRHEPGRGGAAGASAPTW